jgi:tetratricopeptide (TPR) repeat protein
MHKDSILLPAESQFLLELKKDTLLNMAMHNITMAVDTYEDWKNEYASLSEADCKTKIQSNFFLGLEEYPEEEKEKFLKTRLNTFMQNQVEIDRRLSVSYTNMGIAYRQQEEYDLAIAAYRKAIALWDKNLTAENNLNVLLGRPMKEPSVIQKIFPPDKEKAE